jgi:hypothetical protein
MISLVYIFPIQTPNNFRLKPNLMITFPLVTYVIYHNFKHKNKFTFYTYNSSICYITYTTPIYILELEPNPNWSIGSNIWHKKLNFGTLVVKNVKTTNILLSMCKWTCQIDCKLLAIPVHIHRIIFILPCLKTKIKAISTHTPSSYQSP